MYAPGRLNSVREVLGIHNPSAYKLHLATWNQHYQPLDVLVRNWDEWVGWSRNRWSKNEFGRPKIMALADFFLLGPVFGAVLGRVLRTSPRAVLLYLSWNS